MELFEIEARECIRDLVARYNANGDAGRFDSMLALFTEDAVLEVPDHRCEGRSAIRAFFEGVRDRVRDRDASGILFIRHYTATHQIDVLGPDQARGRCYYAVLTDRGLDHWGRYVDEYHRIAGEWRFTRRTVTTDGFAKDAWAKPEG